MKSMVGIRVSITRYLSDDPPPGVVACEFVDVHGRCWQFVEKTAIVTADDIHAGSTYPHAGVIACEVLAERPTNGGQSICEVDTDRPWGVESVDGQTRFELSSDALTRWEAA